MPDIKHELLASDLNHVVHSLHNRRLQESAGHVWSRAEGVYLFDADGQRYIDALSGLWNVPAGHGRHELAEVAGRQLQELDYCSGYAGSTNPAAIRLAERLARLWSPSGITRFFFTSGGGEATDAAVKTARYFWKARGRPTKTKVISRQWGYHGTTLAAMSATGIASYWPMFEPRVPGFIHIPSPYPYRYVAPRGESPGIAAANELEQALLREGPETVAVFLAEPVQGAGGVIVPPADYFPRIREICDRHDVLLAADEVITGFGRTGRMFGLDHWGVRPDLTLFAKAITNGCFPLGGIGLTESVAQTLDQGTMPWMHAHTYSGHPLGCALALRCLDLIEEGRFPEQAREKGLHLLQRLRESLAQHPHVGDVRGLGLMCAVEFVWDKETKAEFPAEAGMGQQVHLAAQRRGLFTRLRGDVFCLAPPIVSSTDVLDEIVDILSAAVREVLG